MKSFYMRISTIVLLPLFLGSISGFSADISKEDFHLYLLVGQSNMAGRGKVSDADRKPHQARCHVHEEPVLDSGCRTNAFR